MNNSPLYFPGFEPESIQKKLKSYFASINSIFPNKHIVYSRWDSLLNSRTIALCEELGYSRVTDFFCAYGYTIEESDIQKLNILVPGSDPTPQKGPQYDTIREEQVHYHQTFNNESSTDRKVKKAGKKKWPVFLLFILLLCAAGGGYYFYNNFAHNFVDNPRRISKAAESVLILYCYDNNNELIASGSGFSALEENIVITNFHVIEGVSKIQARSEDGKSFNLDINDALIWDRNKDIAIFKSPRANGITLLPVGQTDRLLKGEKVVVIGSPKGYVNTVTSGIFSGVYSEDGIDYVQFDAAVASGSSGGPVFNNNGKIIGMTTWGRTDATSLNFAVTIEQIQEIWNKYQSGYYNSGNAKKQFEAEKLLNKGDYQQAKSIFSSLGMDEMVIECNYQIAQNYLDNGEYYGAMIGFHKLYEDYDYRDSYDAWLYSTFYYATEIVITEDRLTYPAALNLASTLIEHNYPKAEETYNAIAARIYDDMVKNYNEGNYFDITPAAKALAEANYKDSKQYNILLKKHNAVGSLSFDGRMPTYNISISDSEFELLVNNIDLADTKEFLVCNHSIGRKFLTGTWTTEYGQEFAIDETGYLNDGLPRVIYGSGYWEIRNSYICVHTDYDKTEKLDKEIEILSRNKIKVYCYADKNTYILTRK